MAAPDFVHRLDHRRVVQAWGPRDLPPCDTPSFSIARSPPSSDPVQEPRIECVRHRLKSIARYHRYAGLSGSSRNTVVTVAGHRREVFRPAPLQRERQSHGHGTRGAPPRSSGAPTAPSLSAASAAADGCQGIAPTASDRTPRRHRRHLQPIPRDRVAGVETHRLHKPQNGIAVGRSGRADVGSRRPSGRRSLTSLRHPARPVEEGWPHRRGASQRRAVARNRSRSG